MLLAAKDILRAERGADFLKCNCETTLRKRPRDASFTRMIYTHVLNRPGLGIRSPLDNQIDFHAPDE